MNDDLTLLASSYLDGDVTADERALVETDPDALAEVERLRSVRALLGNVEPPAISVRESHLAAALGAWDRLPEAERTGARRDRTPSGIDAAAAAGAASVTAPTPLNSRRRPTSTRWLTGAAAAMVLVLAGGVALQLGSADDESSSTEAGTELLADSEALIATERSSGDAASDELAPGVAASEAADSTSSALDTGIDDAAPPGETSELDLLENLTDLADFASAAFGAPAAPDVPTTASAPAAGQATEGDEALAETEVPLCRNLGIDLIVGPALYLGAPVIVGIDEGRNLAIAYVTDPCTEVARVRLP
jgi:hypothetical protein